MYEFRFHHTQHLTLDTKHNTWHLTQNILTLTLTCLRESFSFEFMGAQDLAMVYPESTRRLLGVYSESTRSLLGVYLESLGVYLESLGVAQAFQDRPWDLHFRTRFWTPILDPFWTKFDPKWAPKMIKNLSKIALDLGPFTWTIFWTFFAPNLPKC